MADVVFPKGIRVFAPKNQYSKGSVVIEPTEFIEWLKGEGKEHLTEYKGKKQINLQLGEGKSGNWYAKVDTYKQAPKKQEEGSDLPW